MNILLLQGPLGPFFQVLSHQLQQASHQVCKVHFNGGDAAWPCAGDNVSFTGTPQSWNGFIRRLIKQRKIDTVICYGDCRFYHKVVSRLCRQKNIPFWAMEEGYLRPDFITLECGGVNAFSPYYPQRDRLVESPWPTPYQSNLVVGPTFTRRAWYATRYHVSKALLRWRYPHNSNHRPWSLYQEARGWVMGGVTKWQHKLPDHRLMKTLTRYRGRIFFVPLQVTEDFQIREHSDLSGVEEMVAQVISSFAQHAHSSDILLFKHHPMDRGYVSYRAQIDRLCKVLGLQDRVFYGFELPLPALYPLLKGVVTINSTVGLSALLHEVPTFCMGRALYDIEGLTSRGSLARFWHHPAPVCPERFERLRQSLLHLTQLNASFYRHLSHGAALVARRVTGEETARLPARKLKASA
ncbi:capsule biosynthesis protein [Aeromonas taiwanensis]|uniref:Capsule biosynthesis protein n=1 Tax=Aeromonas taiwanensis TaxID=633417 RepID=A0A5F0K7P7_9GAMM|nr:capsular biosynthesis protein [Aeromonas taiwanensis]TFF72903.1 capsule biosynthesis protein [Aeromonas taiwanensis]TFF73627.1 capsule biosynthesis protein [Aeromonas taiwanensis]TFF76670.1 capsule biosynthesis protein [Aeromonas taiwanensis]